MPAAVTIALRTGFAVAVLATLYFALRPAAGAPVINDKVVHATAFCVLTVLGRAAFPRLPPWAMPLALAALGGGIEVVQGLPMVGRDEDALDWIADLAGIAGGQSLAILATVRIASKKFIDR